METKGLLQYSGQYCGCAAKLDPWHLNDLLDGVRFWTDAHVLIPPQDRDDVGAYRLPGEVDIVQSVDIITPVIDDAFLFGQIAAYHCLSDIYAKMCTPLFSLSILGVPDQLRDMTVAHQVLLGAAEALRLEQVSLLGGHTITDDIIKLGFAITGVRSGEKIVRNNTAQPGDVIMLTKALGVGALTTGMKWDTSLVSEDEKSGLLQSMLFSNRVASETACRFDITACTDVTGFGLAGHLVTMLEASNCSADLFLDKVPTLPGAIRLISAGINSRITHRNQDYCELKTNAVEYITHVTDRTNSSILFDPQTSGGLLICVRPGAAQTLLDSLHDIGYASATVIGEIAGIRERRLYVH